MAVLGIDYGTKRIGLAIANGPLAEPLKILENTPQAVKQISELCQELGVTLVVIGISENEMAEKTRHFISELAAESTLPIETVDETLSSYDMHRRLRTEGVSRSVQQGHIDHFVATQLLQEWLDENE